MNEHLEWSEGRKSCWPLTARVLFGFGAFVAIGWLAGIIGAGNAELVAATIR